jgi:hypothetical protein
MAVVLLAVCAFHAFVLPQTPGRMARPSAGLIDDLAVWRWLASAFAGAIRDPLTVGVSVLAASAVSFAAYGAALVSTWRQPASKTRLAIVIGGAVACYGVAVLALPTASTDIYNYILNGRIAAVHGSNPYYHPASEFPDDPIYAYVSPRQARVPADAKLPLWTLISTGLAAAGGDDPVHNLILYRSALLAFNLANLLLVGLLLHRLCPDHMMGGLVAYAWNPIVAVLGQSKTDTVMVFFLLLAVLLIVEGRRRTGAVAIALSAAVKLLTAPFAVVYAIGELRRAGWREAALVVGLMAVAVAAVFAIFWEGPSILTHHARWSASGGQAAPSLLRPLLTWGFVALVAAVGFYQDGSPERMLRGWAVVAIYFSLFLAKFAFGWYLMTLVAVISLVPDWRYAFVATILSLSAFTFDVWYRTYTETFRFDVTLPGSRLLVYVGVPCAAAVAAAAYTAWKSWPLWSAKHEDWEPDPDGLSKPRTGR